MSVVIILRFDTYPRHESMLKSGKKMTHILVAESDISPSKRHQHPRQHARIKARQSRSRRCLCHMTPSTPLACLIWANQACTHSSAGRVDAKWRDHTAGTNCNGASGVGNSQPGCRVGHKPIQARNTHVSIARIKARQSRSRRCLCHMTQTCKNQRVSHA